LVSNGQESGRSWRYGRELSWGGVRPLDVDDSDNFQLLLVINEHICRAEVVTKELKRSLVEFRPNMAFDQGLEDFVEDVISLAVLCFVDQVPLRGELLPVLIPDVIKVLLGSRQFLT